MAATERTAPLAQHRAASASATRDLWAALDAGTPEQVLAAIEAGADVTAARDGRSPLHALDRFGEAQASAITLAMVVHGADVSGLDAALRARLTRILREVGFGCGAEPADAMVGMHMLPPSLFSLYRELADTVRQAERDPSRHHLQQDLHDAIEHGRLAPLIDALMSGARPVAVRSWDAFDEFEAGIGLLMMVAYGGPFEAADEATMDQLMFGLAAVGYDCGGDNVDALVGMHMLPESLHGVYMTMAAAAAKQQRRRRVLH